MLNRSEDVNIIEMRKQISRMRANARVVSKPSICILCSKPQTSFCNSHSVPKFSLRNIAHGGKVLIASALIGMETIEVDSGINNSGTFHFICSECDGTFFQDYENETNY